MHIRKCPNCPTGLLLLCRWLVDVQNIFYQGNKKRHVPSFSEPDRLISYFNSVATLMTNQLQNLGGHSMRDYTDLLVQPPVLHTCTRIILYIIRVE